MTKKIYRLEELEKLIADSVKKGESWLFTQNKVEDWKENFIFNEHKKTALNGYWLGRPREIVDWIAHYCASDYCLFIGKPVFESGNIDVIEAYDRCQVIMKDVDCYFINKASIKGSVIRILAGKQPANVYTYRQK